MDVHVELQRALCSNQIHVVTGVDGLEYLLAHT